MNTANEVQESIKIALDAADAATDVTSEYSKIKTENKKLEASVKQIHKFTTIIFAISILAAVIGLSLTALVYTRTMNELSAMTSTSREALVVFAENVEGVKGALERLEQGIEEQGRILETNNALIEGINNLDKTFSTSNKMMVEELNKLTGNLSASIKNTQNKSVNNLKKIVGELKSTQKKTTKQMLKMSKKANNSDVLAKISSNQAKISKNFNELTKAINKLASQSGELAKSVKKNSFIKYP